MNRGRNGKNDVRLFLRPGRPEKANNLIINSLWIVFYVEWHQLTAQEVLDDGSIRMTMQLESKKIDGHRRVVIPAPGADRMKQQSLLRAIRNGQRWMEMLINGEAKNITDLAAKLGLKPPYVTRVLGLNNLAPDIVEAIVNGAEPDGLSIAQIMKNIPEDWNEQRRLFGFQER